MLLFTMNNVTKYNVTVFPLWFAKDPSLLDIYNVTLV